MQRRWTGRASGAALGAVALYSAMSINVVITGREKETMEREDWSWAELGRQNMSAGRAVGGAGCSGLICLASSEGEGCTRALHAHAWRGQPPHEQTKRAKTKMSACFVQEWRERCRRSPGAGHGC
jgi:hypothetical protein